MSEDWPLENLQGQPFLKGVTFARRMYRAYRPGWDHDHCAGCLSKFVEPGVEGEGVLHEGYATTADFIRGAEYEWVCIPCFEAFSEVMGWIDATKANSN